MSPCPCENLYEEHRPALIWVQASPQYIVFCHCGAIFHEHGEWKAHLRGVLKEHGLAARSDV